MVSDAGKKKTQACMMAAYVSDIYGAFRQPKFPCGCCEMVVFMVGGGRQNFYVFCRNRYLDDWISKSLLTSMAAVQAEDVHASFMIMGDLNGHSVIVVGFY